MLLGLAPIYKSIHAHINHYREIYVCLNYRDFLELLLRCIIEIIHRHIFMRYRVNMILQ